MGFIEWVKSFSLPDNESECNALRTGDDPKPVQWTDGKCNFFVPTDDARLGMSKCTAEQIFDMSNNTCSEKVIDTACVAGQYRANEGGDCIAAPVNELAFVNSGEAYGPGKVINIIKMITGGDNKNCGDKVFFLNGQCKNCPAEAPYSEEQDMCVCADTAMSFDPDTNTCVASTEVFSNRGNLSDRDILMLVIIVGLMYRYRKEIKKAFSK